MLGWNVSLYRQTNGGFAPASNDAGQGARVANWEARLGGLAWIINLVKLGHAIDLGGDGYPSYYTVQTAHVLPVLANGPPDARDTWILEPHDIAGAQWAGKTTIDGAVAGDCRLDEWLLVVAWDQS